MNPGLLALLLCKVVMFFIVSLRFFRKGRHTLFWYMTVAPFVVALLALPLSYAGRLSLAWSWPRPFDTLASVVATLLCASAIALYASTVSTHRERIPMWHQADDLPTGFVCWGPYAYVRHPFYASYYLFFTACILAAPTWLVIGTSLYAMLILNHTAAVEERQLSDSSMGPAYRRYIERTGRFVPRLFANPSATDPAL